MTTRTDGTKIEWAHVPGYQRGETWNPTRGCSRISPGCEACYAERHAGRFSKPGEPFHGFVERKPGGARWTRKVSLMPHMLDEPLRTRTPTSYFVNSMSDLFHESLTDEEIAAVFGVMAACPRHLFVVLTKRAERMAAWFGRATAAVCAEQATRALWDTRAEAFVPAAQWPLQNVWIGVSVEDQLRADERIPWLRRVPAVVRFLSVEPQLEEVSIRRAVAARTAMDDGCGIHWCIIGGESGPGARPFNVAWARSLLAECRKWKIAPFVKQFGAHVITRNDDGLSGCDEDDWQLADLDGQVEHDLDGTRDGYQGAPVRVHLRDRKGGDMNEWPADLRVREFPSVTP